MSQTMPGSTDETRPPLVIYGYNCIARHIGMVIFICLPLFIGAGTYQWDWAWFYAAINLIGWIVLSLILVRENPGLLNERGRRVKDMVGTKRWDWVIMYSYSLLLIVMPLVAGFDYRYGWTSPVPLWVRAAGVIVLIVSFIPLTWSMAVNHYFSATVRIRTDRGHHVETSGPYRIVRHPGYVAIILQFIAVPLIVGSGAAWIPALLGVLLFFVRTALEDQTLQTELPGYREYAEQVRYHLLPGVW